MKNLIFSMVMLLAFFAVATFATTTAVPKSDTAAVITKAVKVTLNRKKTQYAYRLQSCTQERAPDTARSSNPVTVFENSVVVPAVEAGFI